MTWITGNLPLVGALLVAHLAVSVPAIVLSVLVAVPLGRIAQATGRGRGVLLAAAGVLYAIPSLPLLIVIPLITGLPLRSAATMIVALAIYGTALLSRTAADAFAAVPRGALEAATATGHTTIARFVRIELPLAAPVLVAGTRVVAMSTIGLTTIGALIGTPSLGSLFTDGFQRGIPAEIATGVVLTIAIALVIDATLLGLGRITQPWTRTLHPVPGVS